MDQVKEIIKNAHAILITAGAGIGVDSGLPDFRGNEGFWKAYPPIAKMGFSFTEMANPQWFITNPQLAWAFYGHRMNLYRKTVPHNGFKILLDVCIKKEEGYFVYTSNVDGQFQKAGFEPDRIAECHGSIHHLQCVKPCSHQIWEADKMNIEIDEVNFKADSNTIPNCINCNCIARPNILMFGDWHWINDRSNDQEVLLEKWLADLEKKKAKLVIIEIGAGVSIPTVRLKSVRTCNRLNGKLIRINPRDFDVPHGQISIKAGALEGIRSLF